MMAWEAIALPLGDARVCEDSITGIGTALPTFGRLRTVWETSPPLPASVRTDDETTPHPADSCRPRQGLRKIGPLCSPQLGRGARHERREGSHAQRGVGSQAAGQRASHHAPHGRGHPARFMPQWDRPCRQTRARPLRMAPSPHPYERRISSATSSVTSTTCAASTLAAVSSAE